MRDARFTLFTRLSPEECATRLRATVSKSRRFGAFNAFYGDISEQRILISIQSMRGRSFASLRALVMPSEAGSIISGECGLEPEMWKVKWLGWWTAFLVGGPILLNLIHELLSGAIHQLKDLADEPYSVETSGLLAVAGVNAIYWLYWLIAREESPLLMRFVKQQLEVQESPTLKSGN